MKATLVALLGLSLLTGCSASLSLGDSDVPRKSSPAVNNATPATEGSVTAPTQHADTGSADF